MAVYPGKTSIAGLVPLNYLGGVYQYDGLTLETGLYGEGTNQPTLAHVKEYNLLLKALRATGQLSISIIGMSNSKTMANRLVFDLAALALGNPNVIVENFAEASATFSDFENPGSVYMGTQLPALESASPVTNDQRRILWFDQATETILKDNSNPHGVPYDDFGALIEWQTTKTATAIQIFKARWPNLSLVIFTPPTYSGYAGESGVDPAPVGKRPERMAYHEVFGIRELIAKQLNGEPGFSTSDGFPLMMWGPYTWSNGIVPNPLESWDRGAPMTTLWTDMRPDDGLHPGDGLSAKWSARVDTFMRFGMKALTVA